MVQTIKILTHWQAR